MSEYVCVYGSSRNRSNGDGVGPVSMRVRACGCEPWCWGFKAFMNNIMSLISACTHTSRAT